MMNNYYNFYKKRRIEAKQKPKRIYVIYKYIREKFIFRFPIIYKLLIEDEYIMKGIVKDTADFIIQSVEEKFKRDNVNIIPREPINQIEWQKETEEWE